LDRSEPEIRLLAKGRVGVEFGENLSGNKEVRLLAGLTLNQVHFQDQLAKGVPVALGENRGQGIKKLNY